MTLQDLIEQLESRYAAGHRHDCTVELRHDRELMVFHPDGHMAGEPVVLERGPKPCSD